MGQLKVVYIYPDVAFAVSFLMNGLILWGTARISRLTAGWPRILAGAAAGGLYSFAAAFPQLGFLHGFWLKTACSVGMFAVSFAPVTLRMFAQSLAVFYIVSFALGGFFMGILYLLQTGPSAAYINDFSALAARYFMPGLLVTVFVYIFFTRFAGRLWQKRLARSLFLVPMKVWFGDAEVMTDALIDTGNRLTDPLSDKPVVIMEYDVLKSLFPEEVRMAFEFGRDPDLTAILDSLAGTSWSTRFRVIPFTSLGKENGLLIGFRPDRIEICNGGQTVRTGEAVVGVYRRELSPEGVYRALLHPDVLNGHTA